MPFVVTPFGAELLIDERRRVAQRAQNRVHLLAIGDTRLQFAARFVFSEFDLGLVRQPPRSSVIPQAQQFALAPQLLPRQIVEGVDLVRGRRHLAKAQRAQLLLERFQIMHQKLNFDFLRSRHEESVDQWTVISSYWLVLTSGFLTGITWRPAAMQSGPGYASPRSTTFRHSSPSRSSVAPGEADGDFPAHLLPPSSPSAHQPRQRRDG